MPERDYDALCKAAGRAAADDGLPPFPAADKDGNVPAVEFSRVSVARDIIRGRRASEMSQRDLARLVRVRPETISRLETGRHTASVKTVEKIERALDKAASRRTRR